MNVRYDVHNFESQFELKVIFGRNYSRHAIIIIDYHTIHLYD